MSQPRVLLLMARRRPYIVPTRSLLLEGLAQRPNVVVYGPGYSQELPETIAEMIQRRGPFDLLLVSSELLLFHGTPTQQDFTHLPHNRWPQDLFAHDLPLVVATLQDDLHGYRREWFDLLASLRAHVLSVATAPQFFDAGRKTRFHQEHWLRNGACLWDHPEYMTERYMLVPHVLTEAEFLPAYKGRLRHDASLMGQLYSFRRGMCEALAACPDISLLCGMDTLQRVLRFGVNRLRWLETIYHRRFVDFIRTSLVSLTCDGTVGYPVRKFFEIPAFGSVLVAGFFPNAQALGFVHGDTCLALEQPSDVVAAVRGLKADKALADKLRRRGWEMVRDCHSVGVRVNQIAAILEAVASEREFVVRWEQGRQVIVPQGDKACSAC